jgi:hypothetical protein
MAIPTVTGVEEIYRDYGDKYLIVGSKGGAPEAPEWSATSRPDVTVQIKDKTFQEQTDREIPVVVLEAA